MKIEDIFGHQNGKQRLRTMVNSGRMPHALLISGPEGIGKLALARALAQYIHCESPTPEGDSCGVCASCMLHQSNSHPDLGYTFPTTGTKSGTPLISSDYMPQWMEFLQKWPMAQYSQWLALLGNDNAQPTIKVEETKEIIRRMNRGNYSATKKVNIIWMPEKLHPSASNRLLKLIEEPEEGKMFIFVSAHPSEIIPTILSRLQRVNLYPLHPDEIESYLTHNGYPASSATEAARLAEGSLQKALQWLDEEGERVEFFNLFCELMRKAYTRKVDELRIWSETVAAMGREKAQRYLAYMARSIRENFLYNIGNPTLIALSHDEEAFSSRFARFIHTGNVEKIMQEINEASRDIRQNCNGKIVLFDFAIQMIICLRMPNN